MKLPQKQDEAAIAPTVDGLKRQCHALIERIGQHNNNLKLLLITHQQLQITAGYKRAPGRRRVRPPI